MSVLIRNGRVVTAADSTVADVFVDGEKVALIGTSLDVAADREIDASGKLVLPGAIDPHTHLDMPFGGTVTIDDFTSGHTAAAFGGTTCHVDFCIQGHGQSFAEAARRVAAGSARARRSSTTASTSRSPTSWRAARSRSSRRSPSRGSPPTSCSWPTRAC